MILAGCASGPQCRSAPQNVQTESDLAAVEQLLRDARQSLVRGQHVDAFLLYGQAVNLECSISGGLGETSISPYEAGRYVERLMNTPDGALMQVLQSDRVPIERRKDILRNLAEKIEKGGFPDVPQ